MKSLRRKKYSYGVGFTTMASLASGKLAFFIVDSMLEQCERDRFLRTDFSIAAVDGRHCRLCIRTLAFSG